MHFYACQGQGGPVGNKIVKSQASKEKGAFVPLLIRLIGDDLRTGGKIQAVRRSCCSSIHLMDHGVSRYIEFPLPDIEIPSAIECSVFVDACPQVSIIPCLMVLL